MELKTKLLKLILVLLALVSLKTDAETRYVDLNSPSPTPPWSRVLRLSAW